MRNVRVALWGLGAMGSGCAVELLKKTGVEITGVVVRKSNVGKSLYEVLNVERGDRPDVIITNDVSSVIYPGSCDICLLTTDSTTVDAFPKIKLCLEAGINVITSAEEMAYPQAQSPELAAEMDKIAKEHGVTVHGTGVNPGMMMDLLAICASGIMTQVDKVTCKRVNSLSPFGPIVMYEQGIGETVENFNKRVEEGHMSGHVGFAESCGAMADAWGWKIEKFEQQMSPIVTDVDRKSPYGFAAAGQVAGVNMTGQAWVDGEVKLDMYHPQQIEPEQVGVHTGDYITIEGIPPVHLQNLPEVDGGIGTIAMLVNMLPFVVAAKPGLKTMLDLPVPRCVMGDYRKIAFEE